MSLTSESNISSVSTNWAWIKVKIDPHPQGTGQRPSGAPLRSRRRRRETLKRQQIVVEYRGGPEASYVIRADGKSWRYPGHWCLHDVMSHLVQVVL